MFGLEGWQQNVRWFPGFYLFIYSGVVYWFITTSELKNYAHFWSFLFFFALVPVQFACKYVVWLCLMKIHYIYIYYLKLWESIKLSTARLKNHFHFPPEKKKKSFAYFLVAVKSLFICCFVFKEKQKIYYWEKHRIKTSPEVKSKSWNRKV